MILYEIRTGKRAFGRDLKPLSVMVEIVWKNSRPDIPDEVLPEAARLIRDCWRKKPRKRHSFAEILMHLDAMDFKIAPGVRSGKVRAFVNAVKTKELCLGLEIDSPK